MRLDSQLSKTHYFIETLIHSQSLIRKITIFKNIFSISFSDSDCYKSSQITRNKGGFRFFVQTFKIDDQLNLSASKPVFKQIFVVDSKKNIFYRIY